MPALSTATLVSNLNRQLYATTSAEKYATFYFAMYDEATHSLTYTNAGHLSPMLLRRCEFSMMDSTGTVVGAFPFARYDEKTVPLEHGESWWPTPTAWWSRKMLTARCSARSG